VTSKDKRFARDIESLRFEFLVISSDIVIILILQEMKLAARILSLLILAGVASFYVGCDGEKTEKSETDQQIEKLDATWATTAYNLDGTTPTDLDYSGFKLTINGSAGNTEVNYTVTGRPSGKPSPWNSSGVFEFGTNVKQNLIRDDGTAINYSVTETTLIIDFTFSAAPYPGRVDNVNGNWHFEFEKE
jgi:hypothetical protein